jgi:DNA-binding NarL/FixJ family response regulator
VIPMRVVKTKQVDVITKREAEVLALLSYGLARKQIAARLHISCATVARHIEGLKQKLGLRGASALRLWAIEERVRRELQRGTK